MTDQNITTTCPTCNRTLKKRVNSKLTPETVKAINVGMGWGWGQETCMACEQRERRRV